MVSSAGVIRDVISRLEDGTFVSLAELHAAVTNEGIDKLEAQVYADVQSLASRGVVSRGPTPRTYGKAVAREGEKQNSVTRPRKLKSGSYSNEEVIAFIEAKLGPAVERSTTELCFAFVLLGEASPSFIWERAAMVLKKEPTSYCVFNAGGQTAVGFYGGSS